jgi:hypothetical protein
MLSSARGQCPECVMSQAISDHMNNWFLGTPAGKFVSMAVESTGNTYGVAEGEQLDIKLGNTPAVTNLLRLIFPPSSFTRTGR